jgi:uncharacterized phiE125 gp8 family phage protein
MTVLRNRALTRVSAPANEPLTLAEAKLYLRVDGSSEDALLTDYIVSARMIAEHWLKRSLISQVWKLSVDEYIEGETALPMGPVNIINSVTIVNRDGSSQAVSSSVYYLNATKNMLLFDSALIGFRIEITYSTGYGDATSVPRPIKHGMLSHMASMYEHRGEYECGALPDQAVRLYLPFREIAL